MSREMRAVWVAYSETMLVPESTPPQTSHPRESQVLLHQQQHRLWARGFCHPLGRPLRLAWSCYLPPLRQRLTTAPDCA